MSRNKALTISQSILAVTAIIFIIMAVTTHFGLGIMAGVGFILIAISLQKWKDKSEVV